MNTQKSKIFSILIISLFLIGSIIGFYIPKVEATNPEAILAQNTYGTDCPMIPSADIDYLTVTYPHNHASDNYISAYIQSFKPTQGGYLSKVTVYLAVTSYGGTGTYQIFVYGDGIPIIGSNVVLYNTITSTTNGQATNFTFPNTVYLVSGTQYEFWCETTYSVNIWDHPTSIAYLPNTVSDSYVNGYMSFYKNNTVQSTKSYGAITVNGTDLKFNVYGYPASNPNPILPTTSVNFFVNNGTSTTTSYSNQGNITWQTPLESGFTIPIVGNNGDTWYFNEGQTLLLDEQLATGWYFDNITLITETGSTSYSLVDIWAIGLDSVTGYVYNITLYITQTYNLLTITLQDATVNGEIYFQQYYNSQPYGAKYLAGIYHLKYGTVMYISATPNSNYQISYFDEYANGIHTTIAQTDITFIATLNTTITAYYILTGNVIPSIIPEIFGISNDYLAVIIYIVSIVCMIVGFFYLHNTNIPFAVGLGLIIATILCNVLNILGVFTYPIDALVVLAIIGIMVLGRH